jgi:two-component system phosphate regulon sensor histidine kinase PhoR
LNVLGTGVFREVVEVAAVMLKQADEKSRNALCSKTELEARLHLRQQLMRQLEAALNRFDQPVVITDTRGLPTFCNAAAVGLFVTSESHAPISWADDVDLDRVPAVRRLIDEFCHVPLGSQRRSVEVELDLEDRTTACEAVATLIPGPERALGVVTVIHDISEKRQEKTRHAEFVASVCHELKTPMAGIRAFTEMLIDGDVEDPQEEKQILGFIEIQVDRLTRLADNMLNLSRMESGVIKVQREDSELNEILHKAFRVVQPAAEQKGITLVSELSDLYLAVHVDRDLFAQAIINLLSNAVKYTPSGGEVRLRSRMHERQAIIEVSDTGLGIPESSLPKIFDRFYRVPENNKAAEGTGLGLALVQYIVTELHNGGISVVSTVGKGSCFTIQVSLGHRDQQRGRAEQPVGVHRAPEPCAVSSNHS